MEPEENTEATAAADEVEEEEEGDFTAEDAVLEFVDDVLIAMGMVSEVEAHDTADGTIRVEIVGEDAEEIIGRYGNTLNALQYLAGLVAQKATGEHVRLMLDAAGYRDKREAALVEQARSLAAEVIKHGQEAELDPLSAFERRIIHNALMDHPDVVTYSEGAEPDRRVVIAPRGKA